MWARTVDGVVVELIGIDPAGRYHPSLVWHPAPDGTLVGHLWDGTRFSAPPAPPPTDGTAG